MATAMIRHTATHRVLEILSRRVRAPSFPALVGLCAFLATITLTLPVEWLVAIAVLMSPLRWINIGLFAAIGSTLASLGLYLAFHHLGWDLLIEWSPDIAKSKPWLDATRWLSEYGATALFLVMAVPLPVPKTPVLAFVAIYRMPIYAVVLAIGLGKLLKYVLYAYIVSRFPSRFVHLYARAGLSVPASNPEPSSTPKQVSIESIRKTRVRRWRNWHPRQ